MSQGTATPPNGRLPDASQGAQHLRDGVPVVVVVVVVVMIQKTI